MHQIWHSYETEKCNVYHRSRQAQVKSGRIVPPLKLRVTYKGERKYYATRHDANEAKWKLIQEKKAKGDLRKTANALLQIQVDAQRCGEKLESFSFSKFEAAFFPKSSPITNLESAFQAYIKTLNDNGQVATADGYNSACISLRSFRKNLKLDDFTPEFLLAYESRFVGKGKSITTVLIYLRSLRAVINMAIDKGLIDKADYPFG